MVHLNSKEYIQYVEAFDFINNIKNLDDFVYFKKRANENQASPLKIVIGDYEISISGDDSIGALPELSRTDLIVFNKEGDILMQRYHVKVRDILDAIMFILNNK
jgi:hypothetical protein